MFSPLQDCTKDGWCKPELRKIAFCDSKLGLSKRAQRKTFLRFLRGTVLERIRVIPGSSRGKSGTLKARYRTIWEILRKTQPTNRPTNKQTTNQPTNQPTNQASTQASKQAQQAKAKQRNQKQNNANTTSKERCSVKVTQQKKSPNAPNHQKNS